jgi:hypothetical protein
VAIALRLPALGIRRGGALIDPALLEGADDRPVFAGGCPRSGTTMLRTMMHSHPDLAIPRETRFILEAVKRRADWGDLRDEGNRKRMIAWLIDDRTAQFRRLRVPPDEARARLMAAPPTLGSILGTALALYAEVHGARRWGDKRPGYIHELPLIFALFADVQFVNMVRDPRAVVASMRKLGWLEAWYDGTVAAGLDRWIRSIRAGQRAATFYRQDQFLELRYESLVAEPEANLTALCRFAGLDPAGARQMLSFHEQASEIPSKFQEKFHPMLSRPVTASATPGWRSQLTDGEIAFIERRSASEMATYGYEPAMRGVKVPTDLDRRWAVLRLRRKAAELIRRKAPLDPSEVGARLTLAQRRLADTYAGDGR